MLEWAVAAMAGYAALLASVEELAATATGRWIVMQWLRPLFWSASPKLQTTLALRTAPWLLGPCGRVVTVKAPAAVRRVEADGEAMAVRQLTAG